MTVAGAVGAVRRGEPVLLVGDESGQDGGDLLLAAEVATWQPVAFMVRHTSGYLAVAGSPERWERLAVPRIPSWDDRPRATYGVSVDARNGVSTGISARDRARTIRLLADPATRPEDLARPGHVVTLRAKPGGVLEHRGRAEAAVDLMRLAGLQPLGVLGEVVRDDGPIAGPADLADLARAHALVVLAINDLVEHLAQDRVRTAGRAS